MIPYYWQPLPLSTEPAITGRTCTPWLIENLHRVTREDFYNQALTEDDLKKKYGDTPESKE